MNTDSKIAVVTGAGSGIGRAVSCALVENGYSVVLSGRGTDKLEETAAQTGPGRNRTLVVQTDVTDPSSVRNLFARTRDRFGRLDLLFNNAGTNVATTSVEKLSDDQWRSVVDTNLSGAFYCTREAFLIMKDQKPRGGRIINNGSISAHAPRPGSAPYTATKHAITGLTKTVSLDGRRYDIACGQIDIGNADTEMVTKAKSGIVQASGEVAPEPTFAVGNVAQAVLYMDSLPLNANVLFLTVMATKMPFVGRG